MHGIFHPRSAQSWSTHLPLTQPVRDLSNSTNSIQFEQKELHSKDSSHSQNSGRKWTAHIWLSTLSTSRWGGKHPKMQQVKLLVGFAQGVERHVLSGTAVEKNKTCIGQPAHSALSWPFTCLMWVKKTSLAVADPFLQVSHFCLDRFSYFDVRPNLATHLTRFCLG